MQLPIADIYIGDRQRKEFDPKKLAELAEDMKRTEQIHPIRVRRPRPGEFSDGKPFILVVGERRIRAAGLNGWSHLEASETQLQEAWKVEAMELGENLYRQDITFEEEANAIARVHNLYAQHVPGWNQERTAELLGVSNRKVSENVAIAKAIEDDPSLKELPSKKAVQRMIQMREHTARLTAQDEAARHRFGLIKHRLVNDDARTFIRTLPEDSIDLTLTDLPFGIDFFNQNIRMAREERANAQYDDTPDKTLDLLADLVPQMIRVTKPTGWLVLMIGDILYPDLVRFVTTCCATHYEYAVSLKSVKHPFRRGQMVDVPHKCSVGEKLGRQHGCRFLEVEQPGWLWYRPNSNNVSNFPERHASSEYEMVCATNMGEGRLLHPTGNVFRHDAEYGDRLHPMQKPEGLGSEWVELLTLPRQVVADFTFGSGAFLRAASRLGRAIYGSELNPLTYEKGITNVASGYTGTGDAFSTTTEPANGNV